MAANMPKRMFALTILFLLTLELVPQQSVARFRVMDVRSSLRHPSRSRRGLLDSLFSSKDETPAASSVTNTKPAVTVEMIPYHHERSPYHQPHLTRAQRLAVSAERTRARGMRISRRLGDVNEPFTSPGVFYNDGSYVLNFTIGTPASTFLAIADTGSDLCWVQCQGCDPCFKEPDSYFNPDSSSTYTTVSCNDNQCSNISSAACDSQSQSCQYHYPYGDGSDTDGTLSQETLTLTNSDGQSSTFGSFYFGCGFNESGDFGGQTDGLVGLGQGPLSIVSQLGSTIDYQFSYCLVDDTAANLTSALLFGSEGTLPLNYTNLLADSAYNPTFYYVDLQAITVGGVDVSYDDGTFDIDAQGNGGIILDSGTTLTVLTEGAYKPLLQQLRDQISYKEVDASQYQLDLCYDTSAVNPVDFPDVAFTLGDLTLTPDPNANIFMAAEDDGSVYCLAFQSTDPGTTSIFGNVWQQNFQIAYDLSNHTVGFAQTTCGMS